MAKATKKLVYGVGINDADYVLQVKKTIFCEYSGRKKQKFVSVCRFYITWLNMFRRCYSKTFINKQPTYEGCYVDERWHSFMSFREWMMQQSYEGKQLDKDILFPGNKLYGPDTCVFVDFKVNAFF